MQTLTSVASAVPATPRPPSGRVPSCPTMAESASRNSGSATSAPNAGTARRRISRSYAEATRGLPETVGGPGGARFSLRNRLRPSSLRHQRALLDQLRYADDVGHHLTERGRVGQQPGVLARDRDARPGYQRVPQRLDEPATSRCCLLFGPNDTTLATSVWGRQTSFGAGLRRRWSGTWPSRATVTASQAPGGTVDGAHALLETLAAAGVEVCFANPGTTELPLVRALEATPGVRAILGLFEGVCTGAADGADAVAVARLGGVATLIAPADCQWGDGAEPAPAPAAAALPRVSESAVAAAADALHAGPAVLLLGDAARVADGLRSAGTVAATTGCRLVAETFPARMERGGELPAPSRLPYVPELATAELSGAATVVLVGARSPVSFFGYPGLPSSTVPAGTAVVTLAEPGAAVTEALARLAERVGPAPQ